LPLRAAAHHPVPHTVIPASLPATPRHRPAARHSDKPAKKRFKPYPIGVFHIDIAEIQTAEGKLSLFVAIDRTSKFAFVQLVESANRVTAAAFLDALVAAVPYRIHTVLTDNGIQFRFVPRYANRPTTRSMTHMFAMRCRDHGIAHCFIKITHPWTNRQVERMNRTIRDATVTRFHSNSHDQLRRHRDDFVAADTFGKRLKSLQGLTPYEFICKTWADEPHRFILNPLHQMPGLNSHASNQMSPPGGGGISGFVAIIRSHTRFVTACAAASRAGSSIVSTRRSRITNAPSTITEWTMPGCP
jgi:transposase InsO family protein